MDTVQQKTLPVVNPLTLINPRQIARYETENWAAYYQKRWLRLLRVSVGMVQETFRLNWFEALFAAYLVARAEIAAAPYPENDIPTAEAYMRRFYSFLKRKHHLDYDVAEAARLEVNWWVVHRHLFGQVENSELVQALTDLYRVVYGASLEQASQAGGHRAQAMIYSDRWVAESKQDGHPLLKQVEEELYRTYTVLKGGRNAGTP